MVLGHVPQIPEKEMRGWTRRESCILTGDLSDDGPKKKRNGQDTKCDKGVNVECLRILHDER